MGSRWERCESGLPTCGSVTEHDVDGVPLCSRCAAELAHETDCHADTCRCSACKNAGVNGWRALGITPPTDEASDG